ncbi:hypothetical protein [Niveispirillum fermenti]|uniref:hypothetical protein n=1 Tax=Niveispirillum fermenti TaxID=1233113 RepID=UPI003A88F7CD
MTGFKTAVYVGPVYEGVPLSLEAYDALEDEDWVKVEGLTAMSAFGESYQEVRAPTYDDDVEQVGKGTANAGTLNLTYNLLPGRPGQAALAAAVADTQNRYHFKVEFPDKPPGEGSKPTRRYFAAAALGAPEDPSQINGAITGQTALALTTKVVKGAKLAGS